MFLPIKYRPFVDKTKRRNKNKIDIIDEKKIVIVPNSITSDIAKQLIDFAENREVSGFHDQTNFSTCLLHQLNHPVYEILDKVWEKICVNFEYELSFIEPYELKCYKKLNRFDKHTDNYCCDEINVDRYITMSIQLSHENDYSGGDLYICDKKMPRTFGNAVFFPSNYVHYVSPVEYGTRWAMTNWAWGIK